MFKLILRFGLHYNISDLSSDFIYSRSNKNQTLLSMPVYSRLNYDPEAFGERSRPDVILFVNLQARSCLIDFGTNIPPSVFPPTKACRCLSHPMRSSATELSNASESCSVSSNLAVELSNCFRKLLEIKQLGGGTTQPLQKVVQSRATRGLSGERERKCPVISSPKYLIH